MKMYKEMLRKLMPIGLPLALITLTLKTALELRHADQLAAIRRH